MSLFDEFRALSAELFDAFELPVATLTRKSTVRSAGERDAGTKGTVSTITVTGRGSIGSREVHLVDGTTRQEATALLNVAPMKGDRLTIGNRTFEVISFEETNPDGGATAFKFLAVLA